ncbi:LysR family transcriptional regulator, partial [Klebsiella pneumoniae]
RQVRLLEESLGVALFERRNRAIFLTPAGRELHSTTQSIFEQLEGAVQRLQQQPEDNVLVVSCEPTIAMRWLIPRLPR